MNAERAGREISLSSTSAEQTTSVGEAVGRRLSAGDVVLLYGNLGAGKTTFVQGLAVARGVREPVTSPTFALIHEYHTDTGMVVHIDPYRLDGPEDVIGLGILDYLDQDVVMVVEWADRLGDLAPANALEVHMGVDGPESRAVRLRWEDPRLGLLAGDLEAIP